MWRVVVHIGKKRWTWEQTDREAAVQKMRHLLAGGFWANRTANGRQTFYPGHAIDKIDLCPPGSPASR